MGKKFFYVKGKEMRRRPLTRRRRRQLVPFTPPNIGTTEVLYKCNIDNGHLYEKSIIPKLIEQIHDKFYDKIIGRIINEPSENFCFPHYPYLDKGRGNKFIRGDLARTGLCLLCVLEHIDNNSEKLLNECFYNEEQKEEE